MLSEVTRHERTSIEGFYSHEVPRAVKFRDGKSGGYQGPGGGGMSYCCTVTVNGYRVTVWGGVMESSRNSPDGHNNMNRLHVTEPYHLKMVKTVNFVIYFTTIHF